MAISEIDEQAIMSDHRDKMQSIDATYARRLDVASTAYLAATATERERRNDAHMAAAQWRHEARAAAWEQTRAAIAAAAGQEF